MKLLITSQCIPEVAEAGNKARNLAVLRGAGFDVPDFFVIPSHALSHVDPEPIRVEIETALRGLHGQRFAVRSSSAEEDGACNSFAGQFETCLDVVPGDVYAAARKVVASGDSQQVEAYRRGACSSATATAPAVLVQEMVDADFAGVAFAADPISGDREFAVVAATAGSGDKLVSGTVQGDTWRVSADGVIASVERADDPVSLDDAQVVAIARLAREVSDVAGSPQDIEWAISNGRLHLLQSRDITTLEPETAPEDDYALWDNSNIVESYGGVTTPLTFSVAREAYQEAYRHMGRVLGVPEKTIRDNRRCYEQMIGLIQGRVYYNLLSWYRLLMLTPGFRYNRKFMEQMMGVTEGLPAGALPAAVPATPFAGIRYAVGLGKVASRLVKRLITHRRDVRQFHEKLDRLLAPVDLKSMSANELIDYYDWLQAAVIPAWDTPLVNDLFCMIFHGALRKLSAEWLDDELADIHNELVAGEAAIVSLEPVRRMQEMAIIAAGDKQLMTALQTGTANDVRERGRQNPAFIEQYDAYLDRFGDRCLDELKLESLTLRDDPTSLNRAIGHFAAQPATAPSGRDGRRASEVRVADALGRHSMRYRLYRWVLGRARGRVRDRENLRFERTRVYGRVRTVFLEIGERFAAKQLLDRVDDIFYLDADEISAYIRGTGIGGDLSVLATLRRHEFARYAAEPDLPRRFATVGPPQHRSSMRRLPDTAEEDGNNRTGQACSKGMVRGRVRIVLDPHDADFQRGDILVAQRTDPGWVTIFPLVAGMIMERGSLLSHSAIIARELNIPAVVGVDNACSWLADGDWVELDGGTGVIRKLAPVDQAA